jgi:hypothetical protein
MRTRTLLFLAAALTVGLFLGSRINAFLSISIKEKDLGDSVSASSKDLPPLPFRMVDLGGVGIDADEGWARILIIRGGSTACFCRGPFNRRGRPGVLTVPRIRRQDVGARVARRV